MTASAELFLHLLERFNRTERFYLIAQALGKPRFELSDDFRDQVAAEFGLAVPKDCFVAMDYHLDWIYAAAYLSSADAPPFGSAICSNVGVGTELSRFVHGSQEDIDLIVAFAGRDTTHLLLLEAKGVTSWGNKQLDSKADRLKGIFGDKETGRQFTHVTPHFAMVSPVESSRNSTREMAILDAWEGHRVAEDERTRQPVARYALRWQRKRDSRRPLETGERENL